MSDIGFQGGQIWDKMVNLHIANLRPPQRRAKMCGNPFSDPLNRNAHMITFLNFII